MGPAGFLTRVFIASRGSNTASIFTLRTLSTEYNLLRTMHVVTLETGIGLVIHPDIRVQGSTPYI